MIPGRLTVTSSSLSIPGSAKPVTPRMTWAGCLRKLHLLHGGGQHLVLRRVRRAPDHVLSGGVNRLQRLEVPYAGDRLGSDVVTADDREGGGQGRLPGDGDQSAAGGDRDWRGRAA